MSSVLASSVGRLSRTYKIPAPASIAIPGSAINKYLDLDPCCENLEIARVGHSNPIYLTMKPF